MPKISFGGLIFYFEKSVPPVGKLIKHSNGLVFEIMESDMRNLSSIIIDALRYKTDVKSINKISNIVSEFARSFKLPGVDD